MTMENLIYHHGVAVGIETSGLRTWFTNATPAIIMELSK